MEPSIVVDRISKKFDISKLKKETQFREVIENFAKRVLSREREQKEEIWALRDISFKVDYGEIVGIIGRNGAGKSTMLKILSKITYPTSGRMAIRGRVGSLLEVGTGFHEELTGRENIFLNGSILGMRKAEVAKKLDEIVDFSEVGKFLDTPIKRYSSGMRLKLGFSVAAHLDTDILFIDEVLAVGDVAFQKKCLDTIKDLRNSGRTVIFVSHTMSTVENLCPRVLWFDKGILRQDGESSQVIRKYVSEFDVVTKQTKYDLTEFPHRSGSGEIRYIGIEFLNFDGTPKDRITSGGSLRVRLHYIVNKAIERPEFYFNIKTDLGGRVTSFGSALAGYEIDVLKEGKGFVDIDIPNLNLFPDQYFITAWINTRNRMLTEVDVNLDGIQRCAVLDVEPPPSEAKDEFMDKWWGVAYFPCSWRFEGLNAPAASVRPRDFVPS